MQKRAVCIFRAPLGALKTTTLFIIDSLESLQQTSCWW